MKKMRKFFALLIAMAMVLGMTAMTAFAATSHSITIKNENTAISINGKVYKAYKLFDSTQTADKKAYAYYMKVDNQFYINSSAKTVIEKYFTLTTIPGDATRVSVTPKNGFDARAFGDEMEKFLASATEDAKATASGETAAIILPNDEDGQGYYLVTGTAAPKDQTDPAQEDVVSAVIVTNEDPDPVAKPKAGIPTLDKKITKVEEGQTAVAGAVLDDKGQAAVAKVGSTVSYQLDSIVPDLTAYDDYTFIFGDKITAGLDYVKDSFELKINNTAVAIDPVFASGNKSFTLTIPYANLHAEGVSAGDPITLTYQCTVNDSALTYDYENNTADLTYSRSPYDDNTNHTPEKKTYVIDLNIDVDKVAENASGKKLDGAEFKLYKLDGNTKLYYKKINDGINWVTTQNAGDTFTTDENGKLDTQIQGLDKGEYYLEETKAPVGYNPLSAPVKVTITAAANGTDTTDSTQVTYTATADGANVKVDNGTVDLTTAQKEAQPVAVATIVNNSGTILPSTGGIGTTIFYVVGSILVVGAGVLLVTRRRMNAN